MSSGRSRRRLRNRCSRPKTPDGIPVRVDDYTRLMDETMALAFETDVTRVTSLLLAHDGSNRSFLEIGFSEGHHSLSRDRNQEEAIERGARIDRFYAERFSEFRAMLEAKQDSHGNSVLHNSMNVYCWLDRFNEWMINLNPTTPSR